MIQKAETDMLKEAPKYPRYASANYYFDIRKRRYNVQCNYKRRFNMMQACCGASSTVVFITPVSAPAVFYYHWEFGL